MHIAFLPHDGVKKRLQYFAKSTVAQVLCSILEKVM